MGTNADGVTILDPLDGDAIRLRAGAGPGGLASNTVRALAEDASAAASTWAPATGWTTGTQQRPDRDTCASTE